MSSFIHAPDEPGYIVAWRDRYEHVAGRLAGEVMTYAEAKARAEALCREQPEKVFWAERMRAEAANRFYNPDAH